MACGSRLASIRRDIVVGEWFVVVIVMDVLSFDLISVIRLMLNWPSRLSMVLVVWASLKLLDLFGCRLLS